MTTTKPDILGHVHDHAQVLKTMLRQSTPPYRPLVEERVQEFEDEIARLQADIDEHKTETTLLWLWAQKEHMEEYVQVGRSLLAPIRRMPRELLLRIFSIYCEGGNMFSIGSTGFDRMPNPILLSMVCALWRDMAISSSELWSDMGYYFGPEADLDDGKRCLRITEMFLQRAGSSPLSLSFDSLDFRTGQRHNGAMITPPVALSLDALCRRAEQWDSVEFSIPSTFTQQPSFRIAKGHLLNLRTIRIYEPQEHVPSTFDFLIPSPALRHAKVRLCLARPNDLLPPIPWQQLKSLSLDVSFRAPTVSHIIPLCTNLTDLELSIVTPLSEVTQNTQRVLIPTLRSLTIETIFRGCPAFQHFFRQFACPGLRSFYFGDDRVGTRLRLIGEEDIACLIEFLGHSSSCLTTLSLSCSQVSGEQAVQLLQHTSRLTSLRLNEKEFRPNDTGLLCTPSLFTHLTCTPSLPSLLPRLLHLKLVVDSSNFHHEQSERLIEAVRSRCIIPDLHSDAKPGADRLQSVEVEFWNRQATFPESLAPLESLRDAGLRVILPAKERS
ncbi:hypothetical protein V5O48_014553 [Marasmius crinis-equi]|uniref:F-box domain-containing protein n=1 Tax=Marasmius crinis-equi TaxID=585013 RepID=A0ABR3EXB6_9AGAR